MAQKVIDMLELDIPTAGTRVQISTDDIPVSSIAFQADSANTGAIYVGGENVSSTRGKAVLPGAMYQIAADNDGRPGGEEFVLSDFWVDTATGGNDVWISYLKRR